MKAMTVDELLEGCRAALQNARDLLDEAEVLHEHGHYARAYFLAHIACEEMAKSPMLYRTACELTIGRVPDWKALDRRFRDHTAKIRSVLTMDYMHTPRRADDSDVAEFYADLDRIPSYRAAKNDSLYTGVTSSGEFVRPSQRFGRPDSEALIRLARARFRVYDIPLPANADELSADLQGLQGSAVRTFFEEISPAENAVEES
jgi:AbiV family abortive infection protein